MHEFFSLWQKILKSTTKYRIKLKVYLGKNFIVNHYIMITRSKLKYIQTIETFKVIKHQ